MQSINDLHDAIVAQLGEPQPEKSWDPEAAKTMGDREKRIAHGFFEDMKKFTTGRAVEDAQHGRKTPRR